MRLFDCAGEIILYCSADSCDNLLEKWTVLEFKEISSKNMNYYNINLFDTHINTIMSNIISSTILTIG